MTNTIRVDRILITGSRRWSDAALITKILTEYANDYPDAVLVHGGALGADTIAGQVWGRLVGKDKVEIHRAEWGKYHSKAGPIRNGVMVDLGADICLAFPLKDSVGTFDCIRKAKKAGIPVHEFRPKEWS